MRLTILADNEAADGCLAEHGFALWIETGGMRMLLDTGQGQALVPNALALGVDLAQADAVVLSHGHYDHVGGLPHVMAQARQALLHAHPEVVRSRYSLRDGQVRSIGMPEQAEQTLLDLAGQGRVRWTRGPTLLEPHAGLSGAIPRQTDFEDTGGPFYLDPDGRQPDLLPDDQALWLATDKGLVVCLGCCHAGLINTLHHVREVSGEERIRAVLGGLHLNAASQDRLDLTVNALRELRPSLLVPCHCTGEAAIAYLRAHLPCPVRTGFAGLRLDSSELGTC